MKALHLLFAIVIALLTVACSKPEPPRAVALYPAYGVTESSAILTWSLNIDEDFAQYTLLRAEGPGVFDGAEEVVVFRNPLIASHEDVGLSPGTTYYYGVQVDDTEGLRSLSNEIEVTTESEAPPEAPTAVFLNPASNLTATSLTLSWSPNTDADFESYTVFRGDVSGVTAQNGTVVDTFTSAATTTVDDGGLTPEATYFYRVLVTDTEDLSTFSNEITVTLPAAQTPTPPTAVSLYPPVRVTETSILLAWSRSLDTDFDSYELYRSTAPGVDPLVDVLAVTVTDVGIVAHDDTALLADTTYYYRVQVNDTEGLSALSNEVDATTLATAVPTPPLSVTLSPASAVTQTTLSLNWTVSTDSDFLSYTVLRSETPGITASTGTPIASSTDPLAVSAADGALLPATTYHYRVVVLDAESLTSLSNEITVTTLSPVTPDPPTAVTLLPVYGETSSTLALTWTVNGDQDFASYALIRDVVTLPDEFSGQVVFTTTDPSEVLFQDTVLSPETDYFYRVVVTNSAGMATLSNEVVGTTLATFTPAKPTPVLLGPAYNIDADAMSLSWTQNNDGDFDRYELYRSDGPGVTTADTLVVTLAGASLTDHRDSTLSVFSEYFYRVWVYNTAGESMPSNEVSGTTSYNALPAPVFLQDPTDVTGTTMMLGWERSQSLDFGSYRLYRSENPVVDETAILIHETPDQNSLFFIDSGLAPDTVYYYRVYVVDQWDLSSGSNIVSDRTLNTEAPSCEISRSHTWRQVGSTIDFTAVNCQDNLTAEADLQVHWNFGDGTGWTSLTTTKTTSHAFALRGAYVVELQVSDGTYSGFAQVPVVAGEVVFMPADTVTMGRQANTTPWPSMEPDRVVFLDEFYVDTYEVTQAEYASFLSDGNGDQFWTSQEITDNLDGTYSPYIGLEERPVSGVTWHHAVAYCGWAGKKLPTEAEWEYAARGPSTGPNYEFPWGNALPSSLTPVPANFASLVGTTVDVTSYPTGVTAWDPGKAIYNMAGNANEWVYDYYDPDYYLWANINGDNNNPLGPAASPYPPNEPPYRVTRGGSWVNDGNPLRVSFRAYADPYLTGATSFRCVASALP